MFSVLVKIHNLGKYEHFGVTEMEGMYFRYSFAGLGESITLFNIWNAFATITSDLPNLFVSKLHSDR